MAKLRATHAAEVCGSFSSSLVRIEPYGAMHVLCVLSCTLPCPGSKLEPGCASHSCHYHLSTNLLFSVAPVMSRRSFAQPGSIHCHRHKQTVPGPSWAGHVCDNCHPAKSSFLPSDAVMSNTSHIMTASLKNTYPHTVGR